MDINEFCEVCGEPIPSTRQKRRAKYCSDECSKQKYRDGYLARNPNPELCTGTVGALSEYIVIVDLLKKGYEIFQAVSPASTCDLVLLMNGKLIRIEVKTGHYNRKGTAYTPSGQIRADVLALVLSDQILYQPLIETLISNPSTLTL